MILTFILYLLLRKIQLFFLWNFFNILFQFIVTRKGNAVFVFFTYGLINLIIFGVYKGYFIICSSTTVRISADIFAIFCIYFFPTSLIPTNRVQQIINCFDQINFLPVQHNISRIFIIVKINFSFFKLFDPLPQQFQCFFKFSDFG